MTEHPAIHPNLAARGEGISAIIPRNIKEAESLAKYLIEAGMVPKGYEKAKDGPMDPAKVTIAIMKGLEIGLPPITAIGGIYVVNGRATVWGDVAQSLILQSQTLVDILVERSGVESKGLPVPTESGGLDYEPKATDFSDDYGYKVSLWKKGVTRPFVGEFTVRRAKRQKLWLKSDPWRLSPDRMLFIRARAFPQRDGFSDALGGMMIAEEARDAFGNAPLPATSLAFLDDRPSHHQVRAIAAPTDQPRVGIIRVPWTEGAGRREEVAVARQDDQVIEETATVVDDEPAHDFLRVSMAADDKPDWKTWSVTAADLLKAMKTPRAIDAWLKMHDAPLAGLRNFGSNGVAWHRRLMAVATQAKEDLRAAR